MSEGRFLVLVFFLSLVLFVVPVLVLYSCSFYTEVCFYEWVTTILRCGGEGSASSPCGARGFACCCIY